MDIKELTARTETVIKDFMAEAYKIEPKNKSEESLAEMYCNFSFGAFQLWADLCFYEARKRTTKYEENLSYINNKKIEFEGMIDQAKVPALKQKHAIITDNL